jgi:hypothetical protein
MEINRNVRNSSSKNHIHEWPHRTIENMRWFLLTDPGRAVIRFYFKKMISDWVIVTAITPCSNFGNHLLMVRKNTVGDRNISVSIFSNFDVGRSPSICCILQDVHGPCLGGEIRVVTSSSKCQAVTRNVAFRWCRNYVGKSAFTIYTVATALFFTRKKKRKQEN